MTDVFTNPRERAALVADAAAELGLSESVVEKDLWVCWVLAQLTSLADCPRLTFKGGTSLSKVHALIHRFSEDIDLIISRDHARFEGAGDPLDGGLSGKQRAHRVDEIKKRATSTVHDLIVPGIEACCRQGLGSDGWAVEVDDNDAQTLLFTFPPATPFSEEYIRPAVRAEFGARGEPWPSAPHTVTPELERVHPGTAPAAICQVDTLEPRRTFWEKATLMHMLHHETAANPEKRVDRMSRHAYDLHMMWENAELHEALLDRTLLQTVVRHKSVLFKSPKAKYELVESWRLNSEPHDALRQGLQKDYVNMAPMFFPNHEPPAFDAILGTLRAIDATVQGWGA